MKAGIACTVKVMLPPDSMLEYDDCLKDTVILGGGGGLGGRGVGVVGRGLHLHNVVLSYSVGGT